MQAFPSSAFDNSVMGIPSKQHFDSELVPTKFEMSYNQSKYADLFIPTKPQFVLGADIQAFPLVDTHIPQLLPSKYDQDEGSPFESANLMQKNFPELENLLTGKTDDFHSLFATPTNKEKEVLDFGIPSDVNSLFDLLPNTPQIPTDVESGVLDFWSTPEKEEILSPPNVTFDMPQIPTDVESGVLDFWSPPTTKEETLSPPSISERSPSDPFVAGEPSSELTFRDSVLSDIFSGLNGDVSSPASSIQSPTTALPSISSGGSSNWDEQLQELFERTFDFTENDFLLMPPAKRMHEDSPQYPEFPTDGYREKMWSPSPPAMPSQPSSPLPSSPLSSSLASPPRIDKTRERGGTNKPRGPLIFGQHEDTIIHKLLTFQPGATSKPITRDKLVSMPVEEFNQLLEISHLTEIEIAFMKEWRRRGKNKTAAQVARKRKREEISELDEEVQGLRKQKVELQTKYDRLRSQIATLKERTIAAEDRVYRHYSKQRESAFSRESHTILVAEDGKLILVPKINSQLLVFK